MMTSRNNTSISHGRLASFLRQHLRRSTAHNSPSSQPEQYNLFTRLHILILSSFLLSLFLFISIYISVFAGFLMTTIFIILLSCILHAEEEVKQDIDREHLLIKSRSNFYSSIIFAFIFGLISYFIHFYI